MCQLAVDFGWAELQEAHTHEHKSIKSAETQLKLPLGEFDIWAWIDHAWLKAYKPKDSNIEDNSVHVNSCKHHYAESDYDTPKSRLGHTMYQEQIHCVRTILVVISPLP